MHVSDLERMEVMMADGRVSIGQRFYFGRSSRLMMARAEEMSGGRKG